MEVKIITTNSVDFDVLAKRAATETQGEILKLKNCRSILLSYVRAAMIILTWMEARLKRFACLVGIASYLNRFRMLVQPPLHKGDKQIQTDIMPSIPPA